MDKHTYIDIHTHAHTHMHQHTQRHTQAHRQTYINRFYKIYISTNVLEKYIFFYSI